MNASGYVVERIAQLRAFRVFYTDASDDGCPVFSWRCRAYDREHAEELFLGSDDDGGWRIVKVEREVTREL